MNKRILIIITSAILILGSIFLFLTREREARSKNRIVITYAKGSSDIDSLSNRLLTDFYHNRKIPFRYVVEESNFYMDIINNQLSNSGLSDSYYVVNNSQITSPEISNSAFSFELGDRALRKLPRSFKTLSRVNKSFTYAPVTWAPWGIYYNKKIFKELGLKKPKTFKDLEVLSQTIIESNKTPFSMVQRQKWPLTSWFDYISIRNNGASFHNNLLAGRLTFKSPEVEEVFLSLFKIINSKWFYTDLEDSSWKTMVDTFESGNTVMALSSTFFYDNISEEYRDNVGWFKFPLIDSEYNSEIVTTSGFITSGNSKNIEEIKELYRYIYNQGAKIITNNTQLYPINSKEIRKLAREDLSNGYKNIKRSDQLLPSFERNSNSQLLNPLKSSINRLFYIESEEEIKPLLEGLEEIRLDLE